jgi:hypothetical protein
MYCTHDSVRPLETRRNDRGSHGCALRRLQNVLHDSIVLPSIYDLLVSADVALIAGRSGALGLRLNCKADDATKQVNFSRMWLHVMTPSLIDHRIHGEDTAFSFSNADAVYFFQCSSSPQAGLQGTHIRKSMRSS